MKLDNQSKAGITNHQIIEAIRLWDEGRGLTFVQIGHHFGRSEQSFRYHFKLRGLIPRKKVKIQLEQ